MKVVAIFNVKGGVGKSTLAANLAWCSATQSARATLLWDLDAQGDGGFMLGVDRQAGAAAQAVFARDTSPATLALASAYPNLDVLPADPSLRFLDRTLFNLGKKGRLAKLTRALGGRYDRVILDCPPVLNEVSAQVMRAADVIIVPVSASPLARRGLDDVLAELRRAHGAHGAHAPVLPVFAMYDTRRKLHWDAREEQPTWPVIPIASVIEKMAVERRPVGVFAPGSPAAEAFGRLWAGIEAKLCEG